MELIVKHFSELSAKELYEIYKLRVSVFIVEQQCPYQDIDQADLVAYHLWLRDENGIEAYARALPPGVTFSNRLHRSRDFGKAAVRSGRTNRGCRRPSGKKTIPRGSDHH